MPDTKNRTRLETEALVIGYAMSRLDREYLDARHYSTWQQAFDEAASALSKPIQTFNNLRDEFDPVHPNPRKGWHKRAMRPDRLDLRQSSASGGAQKGPAGDSQRTIRAIRPCRHPLFWCPHTYREWHAQVDGA